MKTVFKSPLLIELPMPIRTNRVLIRPRQPGEGKAISEGISESLKELRAFLSFLPSVKNPPTPEDAEIKIREHMAEYILRTNLNLSIWSHDGKNFLGSIGFHRMNWEAGRFEIGYWMRTSYSNQGYTTEAVNACTRYLFEALNANRVEIRTDVKNVASLAVSKKLGFTNESIVKNDSITLEGELRDVAVAVRFDTKGLPEVPGLHW